MGSEIQAPRSRVNGRSRSLLRRCTSRLFGELSSAFPTSAEAVERLAFEAQTFSHLQRYSDANASLDHRPEQFDLRTACLRDMRAGAKNARVFSLLRKGNLRRRTSSSSRRALTSHVRIMIPWLEASALSNLGAVSAAQQEHFDEAADWSRSAYRAATALDAEDLAQRSLGNLGWAFFDLGDTDKSLDFFLEAEETVLPLVGDLYASIELAHNRR